ncbi:hypothetical protein FXO37_28470 [Capsicum annuum]|nr:hypothetical protein FXO37_28470 [Capsicum annuum]
MNVPKGEIMFRHTDSRAPLAVQILSFESSGWAFGVIPPLQKQVKDCTDEVSHPRILRWLDEKSNSRIKEVDPFNLSDDALSLLSNLTMDLIKKELAGATTIRKVARQGPNVEALHDQPAATDSGATSRGIAGGVVDVGGSHNDADASASSDNEHVDAQEKINIFEITPYIGPSHPYTVFSLPYNGPSHLSSPSYSH